MENVVIETDRLILRLPRREDFDAYAEMMADEDTARWIGGHMSRTAAWRKFLQMPGAWAIQGFAMFSIVEKASGQWVGQAGPWMPEGWPGTEVGWSLRREFTGKGYAREAATAAIDWAFDTLGWSEVIHCIAPDNLPSQAVARRLGSAPLRRTNLPAPFDAIVVDVWGQTCQQWRQRRTVAAC